MSRLLRTSLSRQLFVGLCVVHTSLLAYGAWVHSPTYNECGHVVAGISHWRFGRFDLYSVNPPFVRLAAALPVMLLGYEMDWNRFDTGLGVRSEMPLGEEFVSVNGARTMWLITIARWACVPCSLVGLLICYKWARDLAGARAGLLAASLWCFSPNVIANAQLCTPDAHAAAFGAAACYTFWRWLKRPTWTQAIVTGGVLGIAEMSKTTAVLLFPIWPVLWVIYRLLGPIRLRNDLAIRRWCNEAGMLVLRMSVGLYVLNLGYCFEGSFTRLQDYQFVSQLLTLPSSAPPFVTSPPTNSSEFTNRFIGTWMGQIPVPFPKHYLIGMDLQQRDFESYGHRSYLAGTFQPSGWWHYYVYVLAVKAPLGFWLLAALACSCASGVYNIRVGVSARDQIMLLTVPFVIFTVVSRV
jgi:4-amino-4-deoxy-L-arabinose transferase-like glycosyltransferase